MMRVSIKFSKPLIWFFASILFLACFAAFSAGSSAPLVSWVLFPPIKAAQVFAGSVLTTPPDREYLFALVTGIPLSALYWVGILQGLRFLVRR